MHSLQTKTPGRLGTKRFLRKVVFYGALGLLFGDTSAAGQSGLDSNARLCETSEDLPIGVVSPKNFTAISAPSGAPAPLSFPTTKDIPAYKAPDLPRNLYRGPIPANSMTPFESSRPNPNILCELAFIESLVYTNIMHRINRAAEAETLDTMNDHWFQNYVGSVSELRGWSDSDKVMDPNVG